MLHSTFSLFSGSSGSWDTSCARKYLRIPEEQLNMIDNIPEWSRADVSRNSVANRETRFENIGNQSILPAVSSDKNSYLSHSSRSVDTGSIEEHYINSDSQPKKKAPVSLTGKEEFLKNISLKAVEKPSLSTFYTLRRSNSLLTVHKSVKILPRSKSEERFIRSSDNMPNETSVPKKASFMKNSDLEKPSTVLTEFQDESNMDGISEMNNYQSLSCPLEYPVQSFKRNIQKLDDRILNHKYLRGSKSSTIQSSNVPFPSFSSMEVTDKMKHDNIISKIRLLEKRFSPSKTIGEHVLGKHAFDEPLKSVNNVEGQKLPEVISVSDDAPNDKMTVLTESSLNEAQGNGMYKNSLSLKLNQNTQLPAKNSNTNKKVVEPSKDHSEDTVLQTKNTSFEESFLSPPVPCGQPPPTGAHSSTKPVLSQMSNKTTYNKNIPVDSMLVEKSSTSFSVFSANAIEKVAPVTNSISGEKISGKRKRKSKNEKSSKRLDSKITRKADIQFTAEQIRNMISIMKIFQADI